MGCGIGQTTVVAPIYLAEIAPRSIRGFCVTAFSGFVYLGIMLGYFTSWGSSIHISNNSARQWIIPTSLHIIFAGLIVIFSFFVKESPRYLAKVGKDDLAILNMAAIRNLSIEHPYVLTEMRDVRDQLEREKEATHGSGLFSPLKELFFVRSNRYRLMLGVMSQLLGQWSGANSITIYAPEFFALLGTTGQSEKLFATAIFGVVKFVSAIICSLFLVDFFGRKRALNLGITLQCISMLYLAIYLAAVPQIENKDAHIQSQSVHTAGTGAIAMIYISGVGWALGWNSIQYLINAEIFPLRVRSLGSSLVMSFHFVNQYGNSKAVPQMLLQTALEPQGTFWFFFAITLLGLAWVWFFLPETAGKPLEAMDEMFALPWYSIGRKGAKITAGDGGVAEAYARGDIEKVEAVGIHVENTPETRKGSMR
jgi:sugar porter (SP) family MFS transporter